jgi:hypothetical protein
LKTFEIILDVEKEIYSPAQILFSVSRNDYNSVELQFTIQQDNEALDLTGKSLELGIKKPSGLVVYQPIAISDAIRGKAAAVLSVQAYAEFGLITAEVYIRGIDTMDVLSPFYFMSRETIIDEELESINDFSALQQVLFLMDKKPILLEGVPENIMPEYVGQMAFDTIGKRAFIAHELTAIGWQVLGAGEGGGGGIVTWADILGKPDLFPAAAHIHEWAEIQNTPAAYPAEAHGHTWNEITEKPTAFTPEIHTHDYIDIQGKPTEFIPTAHNHAILDVTGLQDELNAKADNVDLANFAPTAHNHAIADTTGLQAALDGKADDADLIPFITESEADIKYALKGEAGGAAPAEHTHEILDVTGLQAALDGKADDADLTGKANTVHTHAIADTTGLQAALDGKAPTAHNHAIADTTGLQAALDGKASTADLTAKANDADVYKKIETYSKTEVDAIASGISEGGGTIVQDNLTSVSTTAALSANQGRILNESKAAAAHNHAIADTTGLQAALDGKADDADLTGKADVVHTHDYDSITGKPTTFTPAAHNHTIGNVTGLQAALDGKADDADLTGKANAIHTHTYDSITDKPTAFTPAAHNHTIGNVTGLQAELDGKAATGHNHAILDVTGLQAALDGKADDVDLTGKADAVHNHTIADTTGLQAALDGKAPTAHNHAIADTTGLQAALDGKADDADLTGKADAVHTHAIADTTGLQAALDGKADDADLTGKADVNHNHDGVYYPTTGGNINGSVSVTNKGDNAEQIRFNTDRAWSIKQTGADATAQLSLMPDANQKTFNIMSPLGVKTLEVRVDDTAANGYINAPVIKEDGVPLSEKYAAAGAGGGASDVDKAYVDAADNYILQTVLSNLKLWKGTQAAYDLLTKNDNTLYFITG